jgi:hypothetical protein
MITWILASGSGLDSHTSRRKLGTPWPVLASSPRRTGARRRVESRLARASWALWARYVRTAYTNAPAPPIPMTQVAIAVTHSAGVLFTEYNLASRATFGGWFVPYLVLPGTESN